MLTYRFLERFSKFLFSLVLLQLFAIALGASLGAISPSSVCEILEYPAAAAVCALGGDLLLYCLRKNEYQ